MSFTSLFLSIIPLYLCIFLGFISSTFLRCSQESVAKILFFILSPLVVFNSVLSLKLSLKLVSIPLIMYFLSVFIACVCFFIFKKIFKNSLANLLAFSVASGNSAYLGIPLAMIFLKGEFIDVFILSTLGAVIYQSTVGYFICAKGQFSLKLSLLKTLKLPIIHAFLLALLLNFLGFSLQNFQGIFEHFKGALAVLGMMIVGMGLELKKQKCFDFKFISLALFVKFFIHPALVCLLIILDSHFFHFFTKEFYLICFILSIVPLPSNAVTIASILKLDPQKMSWTVFISTLFSLISIPLMFIFYDKFIV